MSNEEKIMQKEIVELAEKLAADATTKTTKRKAAKAVEEAKG